MIRDDTRQTIKFVIGVIIAAIFFYLASIFVFYRAGTPSRVNDQKITQLAQQKTPIKVVQKYYHLDRGVNSYSLKGTNSRGEVYYFIYLPHSQHAYLYSGKRGVSASKVRDSFSQRHAGQKITAVNLGWYEGKPVWEVSAKNAEGNLAFALYDFKNGNELNSVDNL